MRSKRSSRSNRSSRLAVLELIAHAVISNEVRNLLHQAYSSFLSHKISPRTSFEMTIVFIFL